MKVQKNREKQSSLKLGTLSQRAKYVLSLALCMNAISAVCLIFQMGILAKIITDLAFHYHILTQEYSLFIKFIFIFILRCLLQLIADMSSDYAAIKVTSSLRMELLTHLYHVGPVGLIGEESGKIATLLSEGIEALHPYIARFLPRAVSMVIVPMLILLSVFTLDKWSFLILAITGPLIPIFMILVGYAAQKIMDKKWAELLSMSASFLDMLQGLTSLRLFGRSQEALHLISSMAHSHRKSAMSVMRIAFLSSAVLEFFASLSIALAAVVFGIRLIKAEIPFETSFFVLLLAPEYFMPLRSFSSSYHDKQNAQSAFAPLQKLFQLPKLAEKTARKRLETHLSSQKDSQTKIEMIKIEDLHIAYEAGEEILKGVNLTLRPNELTLLTGESGTGKTTFFRTLLGMIPHNKGKILCKISHRDTQEESFLPLEDISLGWVPQNPFLIAGTIEENLRLAAPHASEEDLIETLEKAQAQDFIQNFPNGLKTALNEKGSPLSAGQIRRLALARALLHKPQLLLLDEPTADLDLHNAALISAALSQLKKETIILAISHRADLQECADKHLILQAGKIYQLITSMEGIK